MKEREKERKKEKQIGQSGGRARAMAGTTRSTSHPQHGYPTDCAKAADRLGRPRAEGFPLLSVGQSRGEERRGEEEYESGWVPRSSSKE